MINHGTHFREPRAIRPTAAPQRGHMPSAAGARMAPQLGVKRPFTRKAGHETRDAAVVIRGPMSGVAIALPETGVDLRRADVPTSRNGSGRSRKVALSRVGDDVLFKPAPPGAKRADKCKQWGGSLFCGSAFLGFRTADRLCGSRPWARGSVRRCNVDRLWRGLCRQQRRAPADTDLKSSDRSPRRAGHQQIKPLVQRGPWQ